MGSYNYCNRCGKLADPDEDVVMLCLPCLKKYDDERAEVERLKYLLNDAGQQLMERGEALYQTIRRRDEATAEVERLTAELAAMSIRADGAERKFAGLMDELVGTEGKLSELDRHRQNYARLRTAILDVRVGKTKSLLLDQTEWVPRTEVERLRAALEEVGRERDEATNDSLACPVRKRIAEAQARANRLESERDEAMAIVEAGWSAFNPNVRNSGMTLTEAISVGHRQREEKERQHAEAQAEVERLRAALRSTLNDLENAHAIICSTADDEGECDGCKVSERMDAARLVLEEVAVGEEAEG